MQIWSTQTNLHLELFLRVLMRFKLTLTYRMMTPVHTDEQSSTLMLITAAVRLKRRLVRVRTQCSVRLLSASPNLRFCAETVRKSDSPCCVC